MKRLALPIILILALVLVTAFGCVQDENVSETPPGGGQTDIGGGETSSGEQDVDDD